MRLIPLLACAAAVAAADQPPVGLHQQVLLNRTEYQKPTYLFSPRLSDPDTAWEHLHLAIATPPKHGTLEVIDTKYVKAFRYLPKAGAPAYDSFTYRVTDGTSTSAPVRVRTSVRTPGNGPRGERVLLVCNAALRAELQNEIDRLVADLTNEGWTPVVADFAGGNGKALWDQINTAWRAEGAWLAGAILIGDLPKPMTKAGSNWFHNDFLLWQQMEWLPEGMLYQPNIWVSRITALGGDGKALPYGSELGLLKRYLNANHAFRTGAHRLPHTAYAGICNSQKGDSFDPGRDDYLEAAFPDAVLRKGPRFTNHPSLGGEGCADALAAGGAYFYEASHGNTNVYMGGATNTGDIHRIIAQVRAITPDSCVVGAFGGIMNNHILTRGGGMMWSCGATKNTGYFDGLSKIAPSPMHAGIKANDPWGLAILAHGNWSFGDQNATVFYGDLSVRPSYAKANPMPVITGVTAKDLGNATVQLTVNASDNDGIAKIEWFLNGHNQGRNAPTTTTTGSSYTHVFAKAGTYKGVRVEVIDTYGARAWREIDVTVSGSAPANQGPVAKAGADRSVTDTDGDGKQAVTLDGSASSDADGTIASYAWKEGSTSLATGAKPSVTLGVGTHTITLTVTDDRGATATDSVVVTVTAVDPDEHDTTKDPGTATARGDYAKVGEGLAKAIDDQSSSKWLDFAPDATTRASWWQYTYANGAKATVRRWSLRSANDCPERDPRDVRLIASNDGGKTWTTLDTRTGLSFTARFQKQVFTIAKPAAYSCYRVVIDRVANPAKANSVQVSEIELLGSSAPAAVAASGFPVTVLGAITPE